MMEKFVTLPFSLGCLSQPQREEDDHPKKMEKENVLSTGLQKLIKSFKEVLFSYDDDDDDDMEIGYPTDVKHVGHIGWDGFSKPNSLQNIMKDWNKPQSQSLPASASHKPFN
ncbi:ROP-interactive CRIB motif-containing protein 4 [Zostera marina]|uniref:ROP-interactive CRIB motif-containing protein 4 n=1 Tax=Zostera marina TaxID=29655 RepID=A0A0K9Q2S0_ZOSMR|nr:ROP-interactive CRIB motif-containing protein 4 [Zostera marina]